MNRLNRLAPPLAPGEIAAEMHVILPSDIPSRRRGNYYDLNRYPQGISAK